MSRQRAGRFFRGRVVRFAYLPERRGIKAAGLRGETDTGTGLSAHEWTAATDSPEGAALLRECGFAVANGCRCTWNDRSRCLQIRTA